MTRNEAVSLAEEFAGIAVDRDSIYVETRQTVNDDGMPDGFIFKVELTSDVVVWVNDDGSCEYDNN